MRGLGDIVTMPLPTDYTPDVYANAAAQGLIASGLPGSGSGAPPGGTLTPDAGLPQWASLEPSQEYYPAGAPPGLPKWAVDRMRANGVPSAGRVGAWPGRQFPHGLVIPPTAVGTGPGSNPNAWMRPAALPDWMLPPALQRSNPLLKFTTYRRNQWDNRLLRQAWVWDWIGKHGGIKTCCRIPQLGAPVYDVDPRQAMPSQAQEFQQMYGQPSTAFQSGGSYTGVDVVLGSFRVPEGYDGCLNRVVFTFTGSGFANFIGAIFWRVKIGIRYARNLGNVQNTYGTLDTAFLVPGSRIDLVSGQTVQVIANIPSGSPVIGGNVIGGLFGWFYPRR